MIKACISFKVGTAFSSPFSSLLQAFLNYLLYSVVPFKCLQKLAWVCLGLQSISTSSRFLEVN